MPVPQTFADLTPIASTNSPQGTESVKGTIDDYLRIAFALLCQLNNVVQGSTVNLASAATVNIGFAGVQNINITGTTTITAFDVIAEGTLRWLTFGGALTLVYNATSLQLPSGANIKTGAGDAALFKSLGGGNWKCISYQRVTGTGVLLASTTTDGYLSAFDWNTFNSKQPAGSYLLTAGGTLTGNLVFSNNTGLYAKDSGGTTYQQLFLASDNNTYFTNIGNQNIYFQNRSGTVLASLNNAGTFSATTITQTSDERKKKRWQRLPSDFIAKLAGIKKSGVFAWKKGNAPGLGVGAQSLEQILPLAVHTDEKGAKTVNYGAAAMVSAIELARAVVDLQARVRALEPK